MSIQSLAKKPDTQSHVTTFISDILMLRKSDINRPKQSNYHRSFRQDHRSGYMVRMGA